MECRIRNSISHSYYYSWGMKLWYLFSHTHFYGYEQHAGTRINPAQEHVCVCVTLSKHHKLNIKIIYRSILIVCVLTHLLTLVPYGNPTAWRYSIRFFFTIFILFDLNWMRHHFCLCSFVSKQSFCIHNTCIFFIFKLFLFLFSGLSDWYRLVWEKAVEINVSLTVFFSLSFDSALLNVTHAWRISNSVQTSMPFHLEYAVWILHINRF